MNVSAAIPAVLLDAGFPLAAMTGVPVLARAASLIAHLVEEQARPIGFVLSEHAELRDRLRWGAAGVDLSMKAPRWNSRPRTRDVYHRSVRRNAARRPRRRCHQSRGAGRWRSVSQFRGWPFRGAHFQAYNRNKRSIALDLKARDDHDVFKALVSSADVYIQNFRPGTVARLGVDYDRLRWPSTRASSTVR